jgi:alpha-tubulin suppressor-like RCC1 family protein
MNGNPIKIFAGYETAMIITDTNKLYSFGDGWRGSLGLGDTSDRYIPTEITTNFDGNPIEL